MVFHDAVPRDHKHKGEFLSQPGRTSIRGETHKKGTAGLPVSWSMKGPTCLGSTDLRDRESSGLKRFLGRSAIKGPILAPQIGSGHQKDFLSSAGRGKEVRDKSTFGLCARPVGFPPKAAFSST